MKRLLPLLLLSCATLRVSAGPAATNFAGMEIAGRELVARLLAQPPAGSITNLATLRVRLKNQRRETPVQIVVSAGPGSLTTVYETLPGTNGADVVRLRVQRAAGQPNEYRLRTGDKPERVVARGDAMIPFAGSDFWLADLGMEFLHWPTQRLLKKELCRGQSCDKLESLAPPGQTNGYVRVISWLDLDTGGPVLAEAYDMAGRFVKEFKPNDFKKVNGQWQLEEMEISNRRTGSRSVLHFQLDAR